MQDSRFFVRRFEAESLIEVFMISAVSAVLLIRLYLQITGYPQVGGASLHIAHMLWGGILMLAALLMALAYMGRSNLTAVAVIGGFGFGTFIDEIGKFITLDNDYFFQPAVSLIYITLIAVFLGSRRLLRRSEFSESEHLLNAVEQLEEVVLERLDEDEKEEMEARLCKADQNNILAGALRELLRKIAPEPASPPGVLTRCKNRLRSSYIHTAAHPRFRDFTIGFFVVKLFLTIATAVVMVFFYRMGVQDILDIKAVRWIVRQAKFLPFADMVHLSSSIISGVFIVIGIARFPFSKAAAYGAFERSVLIDILITQIFIFYKQQFAALTGLGFNIIVWAGLRYMIHRETLKTKDGEVCPS